MRDFPGPTSQGQLTLQMVQSAGVDVHAPVFLRSAKDRISPANEAITAVSHEHPLPDRAGIAVGR